MAGDIQHVIDTTRDPVVAVFVTSCAVTGEVASGEGLEVRLDEALVIAEDRAHLTRPAVRDDEVAFARTFECIAFAIHDRRFDAEEWQRGRSRLLVDGAGQRRNQDAAGFGLPPSIHDRTAIIADHAVIPLPRFGIDGFTHRAEQA